MTRTDRVRQRRAMNRRIRELVAMRRSVTGAGAPADSTVGEAEQPPA